MAMRNVSLLYVCYDCYELHVPVSHDANSEVEANLGSKQIVLSYSSNLENTGIAC